MKESEYKTEKETNLSNSKHNRKDAHSNHGWMMLFAHIVPIGLIILLPMLGFTGTWTFILPIVLMIGIHIWMMKNHVSHKQH